MVWKMGGPMDLFNSLMYQSSTLLISIIIVAALAYIGTNVISPSNMALRRVVGYVASLALLLIGASGFYFGASKELTLLFAHTYVFDLYRVEWIIVGALSIAVGLFLARQSFRGM